MSKNRSLGAKYTKIRKELIDYLKDKGVYEETDEFQVDELMFNLRLADDAKEDIVENGLKAGERQDRVNPSVNVYMSCIKNINTLATKLGITVQERAKLKLTSETVDELDSILE